MNNCFISLLLSPSLTSFLVAISSSPSSVSLPLPFLPAAFSSMQTASRCLRPRAWLGVTRRMRCQCPSLSTPIPPSASGPHPLLSVSFSPITSPDTDTPLLQFPRFQLWSSAPSTRGFA